ncbi:hypothetical protein [Euzebyella saccharophila]|uniref:Uncharacterized protein n=1 Tax=Euzebyella saccharophila TaxID=679664 RepID=A0ABV8JRF2_9FLAO|nr:hypothetical protein [Euzebyella saccharophila]
MKNYLVLLVIFLYEVNVNAQDRTEGFLDDFRGTASVTHNGISLVPSFSLGNPAVIFDLKFTSGLLSFEPDMRFALEGKPWSFIFWFRYKAVQQERFSLRVGAHPALNFRTVSISRDGQAEELLESRRYLAAEVAPNYVISKNIGVGIYYLYGRGFDAGVKNTHFLTLNASFINLFLSDKVFINVIPQIYYLRTDGKKGSYIAGSLTLAKKDFPISISAILNKALETEIVPDDDFVWNISLNYSFPGRTYGTIQRKRTQI